MMCDCVNPGKLLRRRGCSYDNKFWSRDYYLYGLRISRWYDGSFHFTNHYKKSSMYRVIPESGNPYLAALTSGIEYNCAAQMPMQSGKAWTPPRVDHLQNVVYSALRISKVIGLSC
jgi:hypothetical protein